MKNLFCITMLGCLFLSCSKTQTISFFAPCTETLISSEQYLNAPNDELNINSLEINDNCLSINYSAGGCDGASWEIKLIDSENIFESKPPQRNLRLSLKNEESCEALLTKSISFDIESLKVDGNKVLLNITNSDDSILYEY